MKFDFFDRFFGKETRTEEVIDSIRLRAWLEKKISSRKHEVFSGSKQLIEDVFRNIEGVRNTTLGLEKLECHEGMHRKARKIISSSKPRFIRGVLDILSTLEKKPQGYEELIVFNENLLAAISSLAKLSTGEGRYLPMAFGEEIDAMKRESKRLVENAGELKNRIGSDVALLSKAMDSLNEFDGLGDELMDLDSQKSEVLEKINTCLGEVSELENELDSLRVGEEFKELGKTEGELENVGEELEGMESLVYNSLNPLKRPLRKFRKSAEVGECTEMLKLIDSFLQDPVDFFLSEDSGSLEKMLSGVKGLEFRPKDRDKILSRIESASRIDRGDLRDRYSRLSSVREELKKKIASFSILEKEKKIVEDIETVERRIKDMEEELHRIDRKGEEVKDRISSLREEIEDIINETKDCRIKIRW
ncbi:MAG: hypothetical protein JW778_08340 [Candidatus Altiarchaeota archaeon]|nr:hypothetical protein [Candidatus Altiarchaeota archaeon]